MRATVLPLCVVVLSLVCRTVSGVVIYNNFGAGNAFDPNRARSVAGPTSFVGSYSVAMPFTSAADYRLDTVSLALYHTAGTSQVLVTLAADSGGFPGATLAQASVNASWLAGVVTAVFSGATTLSSGQPYWVCASSPTDGLNAWAFNSTGDQGLYAFARGGPWGIGNDVRLAYRVVGTEVAVPEPGGMALLGLGALGWALSRQRRPRV